MKKIRRRAFTINPVTTEIQMIRVSELSFSTDLELEWSLHFAFSYVQPATQESVGEAPLQSIQSPQKIQMIPVYKCREAIELP